MGVEAIRLLHEPSLTRFMIIRISAMGHRLFAAIRRPVILDAKQTPEYSDVRDYGHDGSDFLFVRKLPHAAQHGAI